MSSGMASLVKAFALCITALTFVSVVLCLAVLRKCLVTCVETQHIKKSLPISKRSGSATLHLLVQMLHLSLYIGDCRRLDERLSVER